MTDAGNITDSMDSIDRLLKPRLLSLLEWSIAKPPARKRKKVNGVELAKRAIAAGLPVDTVLEMPDGGALLTLKRKDDADADAEHIETAEELRALI